MDDRGATRSLTLRPSDPGRLRVAVLSNPQSGKNRKVLPAIRQQLRRHGRIVHAEAAAPAEIAETVSRLVSARPDLLVINGGDGTVQAVLTALLQGNHPGPRPPLALLRGGTTNMTAGDVGLAGDPTRALRRLLAALHNERRNLLGVERRVVRVQTDEGAARCGMFFGAGAIVRGVEFFHRRLRHLRLGGEWGPALTIARGLIAAACGEERFLTPVAVAAGLDGTPPGPAEKAMLVLISTLERLFLGIHPYWGRENAPLHYTLVTAAPRYPLLALPALLRGRPNRHGTSRNGYRSHNVTSIRLRLQGGYTLDGEVYSSGCAEQVVRLDAAGPVTFVRLP